jgi:hypothetical protein
MHPSIKKALGRDSRTKDKEVLRDWKNQTARLCKPCWELQYCPYGPLVEGFPLLPVLRAEAEEHNDYLRGCLESGRLANGAKLDRKRRKMFEHDLRDFDPDDYPEEVPQVLADASCRVFGHVCPVFFAAEPLTETRHRRKHSRSISRDVMLKVVRRDGQICQKCHEPVPDNEVEFDHVIPFARGGRSTVDNLRLVHRECNRRKGRSLEELLHPAPIEHLFQLQRRPR